MSANVMLTAEELRYLLQDSGCTMLFTVAALAQAWQPLLHEGALNAQRVALCEGESDLAGVASDVEGVVARFPLIWAQAHLPLAHSVGGYIHGARAGRLGINGDA